MMLCCLPQISAHHGAQRCDEYRSGRARAQSASRPRTTMNANALSEAKHLLSEASNAVGRVVTAVELLRFGYYYGVQRKEKQEKAEVWIRANRPDMVEQLDKEEAEKAAANAPTAVAAIRGAPVAAAPEGAPAGPSNEELVAAAIELADRATVIQARVRGRVAQKKAKDFSRTPEGKAERQQAMWSFTVREAKKLEIGRLKMENEQLRRNEAISLQRWQSEIAKLEAQISTLTVENQRLKENAPPAPPPAAALSFEEQMAQMDALVRSKSTSAIDDEISKKYPTLYPTGN